jgi:hypothetical protein
MTFVKPLKWSMAVCNSRALGSPKKALQRIRHSRASTRLRSLATNRSSRLAPGSNTLCASIHAVARSKVRSGARCPSSKAHRPIGSDETLHRVLTTSNRYSVSGIPVLGLNGRAVCSGTRFREQPGFQSNPSVLPPERRYEEKGMLSATQTHLAKELSNDTASTTHDRGHAGD